MNGVKQLLALVLTAGFVAGLHAGAGGKRPAKERRPAPAATTTSSQPASTTPATTTATTGAAGLPATAPTRPAMRRVHVFLTGRVQGVGFRAFTRWNALSLKVAGWVRNLRDGRVEGVFEGRAERVAKLLEKVKTGPPHARVDDLKVTDEPVTGEFETFKVLRTQ